MLELKNISFSVTEEGHKKEILRDISFTVEDQNFVVITGPNGGGKSTIAKIIAGIETPDSGQILLDGVDITGLSITERAKRGIGFAFQQPVRFKGLTVRDLVTLAAGKPLSLEDACGYLSEVGLCALDYIDREANASLSGGELKRIEIAMAMAKESKFVVFDEPEAGIDLWSFHNLIRVFEHLRDSREMSIGIISHQERILEIADKVIVIADGRISEMGTREEILPHLMLDIDTCQYYREEAMA
ncbi:ATP-binding cassette domain-containing protein [Eubacteriales bacterium OttesenSCG-928-M02]|nr:ATP-binding cassette domain-containing protein [Eubacteriales bacterium OttesenSCG-928-M02]